MQILVPIHRQDLPYSSLRRNTKIFKMMGTMLFPWARRVIWQDAKLVAYSEEQEWILPTDYFQYFYKTIERNNVCASFMGLPLHENTMGSAAKKPTKLKTVQFTGHCTAIVQAAVTRPTVSDDLEALQTQCLKYREATEIDSPHAHTWKFGRCNGHEMNSESLNTGWKFDR